MKKFENIKKVEFLSEKDLIKIKGGYGCDGMDVTSELASGGTTTDNYNCFPGDYIDVTSELASGGTTTDTY